jgi:ATP-dependent DNA helicase RecQ
LKQTPNFSKKQGDADVQVFEYPDNNCVYAFCKRIMAGQHRGHVGVLTETNEEAAVVSGLLRRHGLPTELVQSNESFKVSDLFELDAFYALLTRMGSGVVISDESWKKALSTWQQQFKRSSKYPIALRIIETFYANNHARYFSDWIEFTRESKLEDFTRLDGQTIFVSTIHKSKGKEFEHVYILTRRNPCADDESKRNLYVAMTRAKSSLEIHYTHQYLKPFAEDLDYTLIREKQAEIIPELDMYLTHRDLNLGFFKVRGNVIRGVYPGDSLQVREEGLYDAAGSQVVRYSKKFQETIARYRQRGYQIQEAQVNFRLLWWDKVDERNYEIVLPLVVFRRTR